jgi:phosphoribosyl-AMP cyclohydrolase
VRAFEPDPLAVLVTGSYATGKAMPDSDLDLMGLYRGEPSIGYRTWFEDRPEQPLHVSAGARSLEAWRQESLEPADWSLGFPTQEAARFVWTTDAARAALGDPPDVRRPAGTPELEDFLEAAIKVKRALTRHDRVGARWHAHDMALLAPRLLLRINPERRVTDRRDALRAALSLPTAPERYAADLAVCLGLESASDKSFEEAALRLPRALLAFLRKRLPDVDDQPWLTRYLSDGTLERHLG